MNPTNDKAPTVGAVEASESQSNETSSKKLPAQGVDRNSSPRRILRLRTAAAPSAPAVIGETIEEGGRNYPVVDCAINETTETLRAWCPHCRVHHIHGTGGFGWLGKPLLGHRSAHCHNPASPFRLSGYILRLASSAVPA